jgi:hypothetical protein
VTDDKITVLITASSQTFEPWEETFIEQVEELRRELHAASIQVAAENVPQTKGGAEITPIIEAIVSGGAGMTALCQVIKLWIKQRGDRMISLTVRNDDGSHTMKEITGHNVEDRTIIEFLQAASTHDA